MMLLDSYSIETTMQIQYSTQVVCNRNRKFISEDLYVYNLVKLE